MSQESDRTPNLRPQKTERSRPPGGGGSGDEGLVALIGNVGMRPGSSGNALAHRASTTERRALLVSAAVLMEEALRMLDQGGCSIAGVWLAHAAECLGYQIDSMD